MSEEFVPKSDRKVNKAPIIICAIAAVVIAVVIGGASILGSLFKGIKYISSEDITDPVSTTYEITDGDTVMGDIDSIKLDLKACSVYFEVEEGSGLIDVEYSGDKKLKPEVSFENGKLIVSQPGSVKNFRVSAFNAPRLTITLGKDVDLSSLEMKINAGDIQMEGIKADYFFGDFDAGNIQINDCTISKIEIDADAGNIEIDNCSSKTMNIKTDAGNININDTTFEDLDVKANFGNVEIEGVDDLEKYDIEAEVDAGFVQVGGRSSGSYYSTSGNGSGSIKVNVNAGNVEIDD